ncbi:MAG TPA: hypothetical protein VFD05_02400 [Bacilli bacterium]|nr:hypothetical protein [Bacilli bacterium]
MFKKLTPLIFTFLFIASCSGKESSTSNVSSFEESLSSISAIVSSSLNEEPIVSSSVKEEVDQFAGLSPNARKVAEYLKNNESCDEKSYFKVTARYFPGGVTMINMFAYHYDDQLFATYGELIDTEDDVQANGYVIFEWGRFLKGYFGGNYQSGDLYVEDIQFYEMYGSGINLTDWSKAVYGETNFPNPETSAHMEAGFDLAFMCLQDGIEYGEEFLNTAFSPKLSLI